MLTMTKDSTEDSSENEATSSHEFNELPSADELTPEQKIQIIKFFQRVYEESNVPTVKENTLYVVLFASVISDSLDDVKWALDRGANPSRNMPGVVLLILKHMHIL